MTTNEEKRAKLAEELHEVAEDLAGWLDGLGTDLEHYPASACADGDLGHVVRDLAHLLGRIDKHLDAEFPGDLRFPTAAA